MVGILEITADPSAKRVLQLYILYGALQEVTHPGIIPIVPPQEWRSDQENREQKNPSDTWQDRHPDKVKHDPFQMIRFSCAYLGNSEMLAIVSATIH